MDPVFYAHSYFHLRMLFQYCKLNYLAGLLVIRSFVWTNKTTSFSIVGTGESYYHALVLYGSASNPPQVCPYHIIINYAFVFKYGIYI